MHFLAGDINAVYLATISASVSGVAYAFHALAHMCHACSDKYLEEPIVAIMMEKIILGLAYFVYACYYLYYSKTQGRCVSPWWTVAIVVIYIVGMVLSCVLAPERQITKHRSSLPR